MFVCPNGICEVVRKIFTKAVLFVTKGDVEDAAGSTQLCTEQVAGIEAVVHAVRHIFSSTETEAIFLVDASNAFNSSMNRNVALQNVRIISLLPSAVFFANATDRRWVREKYGLVHTAGVIVCMCIDFPRIWEVVISCNIFAALYCILVHLVSISVYIVHCN